LTYTSRLPVREAPDNPAHRRLSLVVAPVPSYDLVLGMNRWTFRRRRRDADDRRLRAVPPPGTVTLTGDAKQGSIDVVLEPTPGSGGAAKRAEHVVGSWKC
jgi:hypothetical protein